MSWLLRLALSLNELVNVFILFVLVKKVAAFL